MSKNRNAAVVVTVAVVVIVTTTGTISLVYIDTSFVDIGAFGAKI